MICMIAMIDRIQINFPLSELVLHVVFSSQVLLEQEKHY